MVTFRRSTVQDLSEARFRLYQRKFLRLEHHSSELFQVMHYLKCHIIPELRHFQNVCIIFGKPKTSSQIVTRGSDILRSCVTERDTSPRTKRSLLRNKLQSCGVSWNESWASACVSVDDSSVLSESSRALRSFCRWSLKVAFLEDIFSTTEKERHRTCLHTIHENSTKCMQSYLHY